MSSNNTSKTVIIKTIIEKVPSLECRKYLESKIDSLSILQWETIIMETNLSTDERMGLSKSLLDITTDGYESKLISMAISDLTRYGYVSRRVDNYFNKHDPRTAKTEIVFNEYIDFPIIFKKGDLVCLNDGEKSHYLVVGVSPSIYDTEKTEFGDSCYLAYELVPFSKLFEVHCHPHAIELNAWKYDLLSENEKEIYNKIMKIIEKDNYLKTESL